MQRRKFILLSAVSGAAIGLTGIHCHRGNSGLYTVLDKPQQLSYICDAKTIREIGGAYRLQTPAEAEADKLAALLSGDTAGNSISSADDHLFIQNQINQKIIRDFEKGNTVVVKGWILAVTEARQCALFFFNNQ